MLSLNTRILLAASLILTLFLGLTGWVLDNAFRESAESAFRDRLQGYLYSLIATSEMNDNGTIYVPGELPDARFSIPGSGLYAQIIAANGRLLWRSASSIGLTIEYATGIERGKKHYKRVKTTNNTALNSLSFGLTWEIKQREKSFTFSVAEDMVSFNEQVKAFRQNLWGWLIAVAALLLAVQGTILRWGLAPLRRVEKDLFAIEQGKNQHLKDTYPKELQGLTSNINALISSEREHLNRYRDSLSNLAHSLKTPLAVLQGEIDRKNNTDDLRSTLREQVHRMRQIVDYQLQRAATSGRVTLAAPISVNDIVTRILSSVNKVYHDKAINYHADIDSNVMFNGDKGDLMELLGNLIENAFKFAKQHVVIAAHRIQKTVYHPIVLCITIDDDGIGILDTQAQEVLQRGARFDEQHPGQGIGLAVAKDIITLYKGQLEISRSSLGGARLSITLPLKR